MLFAGICVVGVFLMVGPHPAMDPSPWGRGWLWTLAHITGTATVRSTYKAGITATLGIATLFGVGAVAMMTWTRTTWQRAALSLLLAVVVVACSTPFWSGTLYHPKEQLTSVPQYWTDAIDWLDDQSGDSQVLVLPGARARPTNGATPVMTSSTL